MKTTMQKIPILRKYELKTKIADMLLTNLLQQLLPVLSRPGAEVINPAPLKNRVDAFYNTLVGDMQRELEFGNLATREEGIALGKLLDLLDEKFQLIMTQISDRSSDDFVASNL